MLYTLYIKTNRNFDGKKSSINEVIRYEMKYFSETLLSYEILSWDNVHALKS